MQMQMIHPMQPIQPRVQQAVLKQPVLSHMSHVRPAQPWLGQQQLQLPAQVRPAAGPAPAAMPTPMVHMAKLARPLRWVYAAPMHPMQRTQGRSNQVVLPFQVVSTKVAPEKELPKEAGCGGDAPSTLRFFWEFSLFWFCQESK